MVSSPLLSSKIHYIVNINRRTCAKYPAHFILLGLITLRTIIAGLSGRAV
jgi:hypothetical protein